MRWRAAASFGTSRGTRRSASPAGGVVGARGRAAGVRWAVGSAVSISGAALAFDWASRGLTPPRAALWVALGLLVFAMLVPPRVTAGDGWLAVRGPLGGRRVSTDALTSVDRYGHIATCLVLRDAGGRWVELDPRLLAADPLLWHTVDTAARRCDEAGTLCRGTALLRELADEIDGRTVRRMLREAGLENDD